MAKRLLALVAAIAMVTGAFAYRSSKDGGDADGGPSDGGGTSTAGVIVCAEELGSGVCDAVPGAEVEPAAVTADRLIAARSARAASVAGWLAPGPWPAMVDDARGRSSRPKLFTTTGKGLASAPIVAVIRKGQVPAACGADVTWKCLGDAAQEPSFRIGGDSPTTSAGLFLRAGALSGYFGRADYASNDLDEDAGARPWLDNLNQRLAAAVGFGARSIDDFLVKPGAANVYVTGGERAGGIGGNVAFEVRTPTPVVTVAVAYTPVADGGRDLDDGSVDAALRAAGWKVQPGARTQGLPSPGVLLALRTA